VRVQYGCAAAGGPIWEGVARFELRFCTWISLQPPLWSWTWLYHKKATTSSIPWYILHREILSTFHTQVDNWSIRHFCILFTPNCPFPFHDRHQNPMHCFRARHHSPSQTASRSSQPFRHNSHVRTDRWSTRNACSISASLIEQRANNINNGTSCSRGSLPNTYMDTLTGMVCYKMNRRVVEGTHEVQRTSYSLTRWCWRRKNASATGDRVPHTP